MSSNLEKIEQIVAFLDVDGDGQMSAGEVKVLISKITGIAIDDIPDDHPEVTAISGISTEELVQKLEEFTDEEYVNKAHKLLGLGPRIDFKRFDGLSKTYVQADTQNWVDIYAALAVDGQVTPEMLSSFCFDLVLSKKSYDERAFKEWLQEVAFQETNEKAEETINAIVSMLENAVKSGAVPAFEKLLQFLDNNGDGNLDEAEFCGWVKLMIDSEGREDGAEGRLQAAAVEGLFRVFDKDGNGSIDPAEAAEIVTAIMTLLATVAHDMINLVATIFKGRLAGVVVTEGFKAPGLPDVMVDGAINKDKVLAFMAEMNIWEHLKKTKQEIQDSSSRRSRTLLPEILRQLLPHLNSLQEALAADAAAGALTKDKFAAKFGEAVTDFLAEKPREIDGQSVADRFEVVIELLKDMPEFRHMDHIQRNLIFDVIRHLREECLAQASDLYAAIFDFFTVGDIMTEAELMTLTQLLSIEQDLEEKFEQAWGLADADRDGNITPAELKAAVAKCAGMGVGAAHWGVNVVDTVGSKMALEATKCFFVAFPGCADGITQANLVDALYSSGAKIDQILQEAAMLTGARAVLRVQLMKIFNQIATDGVVTKDALMSKALEIEVESPFDDDDKKLALNMVMSEAIDMGFQMGEQQLQGNWKVQQVFEERKEQMRVDVDAKIRESVKPIFGLIFDVMDADGDGSLTMEEISALCDAVVTSVDPIKAGVTIGFLFVDKDKSGTVEVSEVAEFVGHLTRCSTALASALFQIALEVARGPIVQTLAEVLFRGADADGDGLITQEELFALVEEPLQMMEGRAAEMMACLDTAPPVDEMSQDDRVMFEGLKLLKRFQDEIVPEFKESVAANIADGTLTQELFAAKMAEVEQKSIGAIDLKGLIEADGGHPGIKARMIEVLDDVKAPLSECTKEVYAVLFSLFAHGEAMTAAELETALTWVLPLPAKVKFEQFWSLLDTDGDGKITQEEAIAFFNKIVDLQGAIGQSGIKFGQVMADVAVVKLTTAFLEALAEFTKGDPKALTHEDAMKLIAQMLDGSVRYGEENDDDPLLKKVLDRVLK